MEEHKQEDAANKKFLADVLQYANAAREAFGLHPMLTLAHGDKGSTITCPLARHLDTMVTVSATGIYAGIALNDAMRKTGAAWAELDSEYTFEIKPVPAHSLNPKVSLPLPYVLRAFVPAFDEGAYPELEQKE